MPQFMIDWNVWWMAMWVAHPLVFWTAAVLCGITALFSRRRS